MIEKIHWLGHASFRIEGKTAVIYIDPWKLKKPVPGDLVLVTPVHFDPCSPDDITAGLKPTDPVLSLFDNDHDSDNDIELDPDGGLG